jgi:hypothetical protein
MFLAAIDTVIPSAGVVALVLTVVQEALKLTPKRVPVPDREPLAVMAVLAGERYGYVVAGVALAVAVAATAPRPNVLRLTAPAARASFTE